MQVLTELKNLTIVIIRLGLLYIEINMLFSDIMYIIISFLMNIFFYLHVYNLHMYVCPLLHFDYTL